MSGYLGPEFEECLELRETLELIAKSAKSGEVQSSLAVAGKDKPLPLLGQVHTDSLVTGITAKVFKGVKASLDIKTDPVPKKLMSCLFKFASPDSQIAEAIGCILNTQGATAIHTAKLSDVESKLEAANLGIPFMVYHAFLGPYQYALKTQALIIKTQWAYKLMFCCYNHHIFICMCSALTFFILYF